MAEGAMVLGGLGCGVGASVGRSGNVRFSSDRYTGRMVDLSDCENQEKEIRKLMDGSLQHVGKLGLRYSGKVAGLGELSTLL